MKIFPWVPTLVLAFATAIALRAADSGVRVIPDVAYLAPDRAEKLDLYLPVPAASGRLTPAVVWIHGGGWTGGEKGEGRAREICGTLANAGYVAVSIDYRLGDGAWPQSLHDCKNAVRFLRAHAAKYQIDPSRIAVAGGSAGGHLALMVGFTTGISDLEPGQPYPGVSSAVRCILDFYGPANLLTRRETTKTGEPTATRKSLGISARALGATGDDDPALRAVSPVNHVTRQSPPVLVFQGRADTAVDYPQSEELVRVLKQNGVVHEFVLLSGVGHSFDLENRGKEPLPFDLRPVALAFLAKHLGPPAR